MSLKLQIEKLRDEAIEGCNVEEEYAYREVLNLINKEPDLKGILNECLFMAIAFKTIVEPGASRDKIDQHIKKLEEVIK